jgi:secernin
MQILRDHGPDESWTPRSPLGRTICMHAESENRQGQTTGSIVCELHRHRQVHWVTGTAAPCVSIFKPVMVDVPIPPRGSRPTDRYDGDSLWWNHEVLHRSALARDLPRFVKDIAAERDSLELNFHDRMASVRENGSAEERYAVIASCWEEATDTEARWLKQLHKQPLINSADAYAATWSKMNALAGMEGAL